MLNSLLKLIVLVLIAFLPILFSCSDSTNPTETNLRISITDAPLPLEFIARADVTIDKIEIKKSDESLGEPFVLVTDVNSTINLLDLRNGIKTVLADIKVPANSYKLIRIYISSARITLTNGNTFDLDVPSDKIEVFVKPEFNITDETITELIIDFNLEKSFETTGDPKNIDDIKGFKFHPVIRAVNISESGVLQGTVKTDPATPLKNAYIRLEDSDDIEISTYTDKNGAYKIIGVPPGTYSIYCSKDGYLQEENDNITIEKGKYTTLDFVLQKE